ncbi:MAG: hypothetical protein FP831_16200 [Anaerolineae bacterium]|jgi:ABC-type nickel/cobalt efflux system permease component RcnA|nr:hypothetical protein [Anaerolineae bacterium]PKO03632.1 MAG: hypothetical protein CVU43_01915 [Chloroflexi bacterium HGW-Chloroflexi-5]
MAKKHSQPQNTTSNQDLKLPVLLELVFTLSKLTVVLVGVIVMVLTFANGNPYWMALLRGGVTVLGLGLIVWFASWIVSKGVIDSARNMLKEANDIENASSGISMDTNA